MNRKKVLISIIIFTTIIIVAVIALSFSKRHNNISISESKWNNIISTRSENTDLVLENIKFNGYNLIIDETGSTLYYSLINDSKKKYSPNVSFKTGDKNIKLAILSDEITDEKILGRHKFKLMIYNDSEYHIYDFICTNLPILNISYREESTYNGKSIPMEIYLFNNLSNTPNRITISSGKFKPDGKNYKFSLNMISPGKNIRKNVISILNMKPESKYILTEVKNEGGNAGTFDEESGERDNRVELFINSEYMGIYSIGYDKGKEK